MRDRLIAVAVMLAGSVLAPACANAPRAYRAHAADPELLHQAVHQLTEVTVSRARMDSARTAMEDGMRRLGIPARVFRRSIAYGDRVAQHILAWAAQDHYLQTRGYPKYSVTAEPGRWIPTPPAYMDAIEPHWGELRPFVMDSGSQIRS